MVSKGKTTKLTTRLSINRGVLVKNIHGDFNLVLSGNIMFTEATGPWNAECVEKFNQAYFKLVMPFIGRRWGDLVVLHGESLLIPSAEQRLTDVIIKCRKQGLTDVALIMKEATVKSIAESQFKRVYQNSGVQMQFFNKQSDAIDWLTMQGLRCHNSNNSGQLENMRYNHQQ
jgi:hypothetical protein